MKTSNSTAKFATVLTMLAAVGLATATPSFAEDAAAPAAAASDAAPAADAAAADAPDTSATTPPTDAAATTDGATEPAAADSASTDATDAAPAATSAAASLNADDLTIGTPVFSSDGTQIGELNRVSIGAEGSISEIQVTTGSAAGLNAETVAVPADKIAQVKDGVRLSLSAADAKALPVTKPDAS